MASVLILSESTKFENLLDSNLKKFLVFYEQIKKRPPSNLRTHYDMYWNALSEKETDANKIKTDLNDSIQSINNCIIKVNEINKVLEKMKILVNTGKVGTLEGIARQNIETNNIPTENLSQPEQEVLKQHYDELKQINLSGGFRKKTKSKKGKKRKTIKKRRFTHFLM